MARILDISSRVGLRRDERHNWGGKREKGWAYERRRKAYVYMGHTYESSVEKENRVNGGRGRGRRGGTSSEREFVRYITNSSTQISDKQRRDSRQRETEIKEE